MHKKSSDASDKLSGDNSDDEEHSGTERLGDNADNHVDRGSPVAVLHEQD